MLLVKEKENKDYWISNYVTHVMMKLSFLSLPGQNPLVLTISMKPLHITFGTILAPVLITKKVG